VTETDTTIQREREVRLDETERESEIDWAERGRDRQGRETERESEAAEALSNCSLFY
jgi:hypothetical protein